MVDEERLPASRGAQDELVAVGSDAFLHRQIGEMSMMQRLATDAVSHLDAERRERITIVGFLREETDRLLDEGVENSLLRGSRLHCRECLPKKRRHIHRVVAWLALHQCELAAHVVADAAEFTLLSSLHAKTLQWQRTEVSPKLCASFRYSSIHCLLIWLLRL